MDEALADYSASGDKKLADEMLARAAGPHIEVMELLLAHGAEPSLIDKEGNTVDAAAIVQTYRSLAKGAESAREPRGSTKDEL